jgi:hypothetical protein
MRFSRRSLVLLPLVFFCNPIGAEEWVFDVKEVEGNVACNAAPSNRMGSPGEIVAMVNLPAEFEGRVELTLAGKTHKKEGKGALEVRVPVAGSSEDTFSVAVVLKKGEQELKQDCLKEQHVAGTEPPKTPTTPGPTAGLDQRDARAWEWMTSAGLEKLREVDQASRASGKIALIHFPSGNVASATVADSKGKLIVDLPFPHSLPEGSRIQAYIVVPMNDPTFRAELVVTDCPVRERIRILGEDAGDAGDLQAKSQGTFRLLPIGPELRCGAPSMSYKIGEVSETTPEVKITLRPRYHLAATVLWGFDLLKEPSFFVAADNKISQREETAGPAFRVGFTWFPGGMDLDDEGWKAAPFLAFDPKAAADSFVVGLSVSKIAGIAVAAGVSVRKVAVLDGKSVGDTLEGDGAVPVRNVWSKEGVSFIVGVALDTTIFKRVKTVFGGIK